VSACPIHQLVNFRRALVSEHRFKIVGMAEHRVLKSDAIGAQYRSGILGRWPTLPGHC
jgi:hypothetical protein